MDQYKKYLTERFKERGLKPIFKNDTLVGYVPISSKCTIELSDTDREILKREVERYRDDESELAKRYVREIERILKRGKIEIC